MNIQRKKPATQDYSQYTADDFSVWNKLFNRQEKLLQQYACTGYLQALRLIGFNAQAIPHIEEVNNRLHTLTGWQLTVVPGLVPAKDFFILLSKKIFPVTCWLRTLAELDYIEEPDMFHDVFGHVPLLSNGQYAAFMQAFGELALAHHEDAETIELLGRIYWYTIEFGLIEEQDGVKIYGAGILSSPGETLHCMSNRAERYPFDGEAILHTAYRTDVMQQQYFVVDSFETLYHNLDQLKHVIPKTHKQVPV